MYRDTETETERNTERERERGKERQRVTEDNNFFEIVMKPQNKDAGETATESLKT